MAIRFDSKTKTYTLHTLKSTYQMKVDDRKVLLHTYFGPRADESDFSYLIVPEDHGFCGQPAGDGRFACAGGSDAVRHRLERDD